MMGPLPRSKKSLGQNFLTDPNMVRKIIAAAELGPQDTVFEIGPGRGALTLGLCQAVSRVVAVERDAELVDYLKIIAPYHNLDLQKGDALVFPYDTLPENTVVVANLPYYISTPLLFRLLEARDRFSRLILMLQMEVARRLVAKPCTREYGILSVLTQYFSEASLLFKMPPTCFHPRPDVDSAVVRLIPRKKMSTQQEAACFANTVRSAFGHRRKMIANSFREAGWSVQDIHVALAQAGIAPTRRAETLTVQEFVTLAKILQQVPFAHGSLTASSQ